MKNMLKQAIPILFVRNCTEAEAFYCKKPGFKKTFSFQLDDSRSDPRFMGLERDGVELYISSFPGDGVPGNVVQISVEDVDLLHKELRLRGTDIDLAPIDQTWGNREMYIKDPDNNTLRFVVNTDC